MLSEGDLIVAELPQADGGTKPRPVLLLKELPGFGDFLVCGVSSQIHQAQDGFDQIVASTDDFFDATGLQVTSVIRLNFLATLPPRRMTRHLGQIPSHVLGVLQSTLAAHLKQTK
jgi:mRNA interferase MazF